MNSIDGNRFYFDNEIIFFYLKKNIFLSIFMQMYAHNQNKLELVWLYSPDFSTTKLQDYVKSLHMVDAREMPTTLRLNGIVWPYANNANRIKYQFC